MKLLFLLATVLFAHTVAAKDYQVYFLGGQSNMEGFGYSKDLSGQYQGIDSRVMIFNGNIAPDDSNDGGYGAWMPLSSGFGTGYKADQDTVTLSNRFGPELSFGKHLASLSKQNIAIIKYARGGSSIALGASGYGTWAKRYNDNTGINQWDHFVTTVKHALSEKDIDGDGTPDKLTIAGIVWMQGEADAYDASASKVYLENLTTLMNDFTEFFAVGKLPIVLGRIEDSGKTPKDRMMPHIEKVWAAQQQYAQLHDHVTLVQLPPPIEFIQDKWHYQSRHYIELGKLFAEAINAANK